MILLAEECEKNECTYIVVLHLWIEEGNNLFLGIDMENKFQAPYLDLVDLAIL